MIWITLRIWMEQIHRIFTLISIATAQGPLTCSRTSWDYPRSPTKSCKCWLRFSSELGEAIGSHGSLTLNIIISQVRVIHGDWTRYFHDRGTFVCSCYLIPLAYHMPPMCDRRVSHRSWWASALRRSALRHRIWLMPSWIVDAKAWSFGSHS